MRTGRSGLACAARIAWSIGAPFAKSRLPGDLEAADMISRVGAAGVAIWKPRAPDRSAALRADMVSARQR